MKVRHTFIIPAYGESPYLEECIQSLLHQTVESSILITTSTPSDFIFESAQKYQLKVQTNPVQNAGIAGDWNFALSQAQTPFVTLAHQDEIYHPQYTHSIFRQIDQNPNKHILILFTNYQELLGNTLRERTSIHSKIKRLLLSPFLLKQNIETKWIKRASLALGNPICCPSVTFHKVLIPEFTFSERFKVVLDWNAWLSLADKQGYFCYLNEKLISHRIHSGAETFHQIQSGLRYKEELEIFSRIWGKTIAHLLMKFYVKGHRINTKVGG